MSELFDSISSFFSLISEGVDSLVAFFGVMFNSMSYLFEMAGYMPTYFMAAATMVIAVAIICNVINRG